MMFSILAKITLIWLSLHKYNIVDCSRGTVFRKDGGSALKNHVLDGSTVASLVECGLKCTSLKPKCKSFNYIKETSQSTICETNNITKHFAPEDDFIKQPNSDYFEPLSAVYNQASTKEVNPADTSDEYEWTLIARFSNADTKNWMEDRGTWWYDRQQSYGKIDDPGDNTDMISEAFWLKNGNEFKITRSDDPTHTALLTTTGNCLGGKTFRAKMASYGEFRFSTSWAWNNCRDNCSVVYGGNYRIVEGFSHSTCDGNMQRKNNIGFWCHHGYEGAVLMIGGAGSAGCDHADHGIAITNDDNARFQYHNGGTAEYDFGNTASAAGLTTASYSLNLWVR